MSTDIEKCNQSGHIESSSLRMEQRKSETKEEWLKHYSDQIFSLWLRWQTPLGISHLYIERVMQELSEYYNEPLKRKFIEATYL